MLTCNGVGCWWLLAQPSDLVLHDLVVKGQAAALVAHLSMPQHPQVEGVVELQAPHTHTKTTCGW